MSDVLRGDFEKQAAAWTQLVNAGIAKPSEARPTFDLGDAGPMADKLYAHSAIQPLEKRDQPGQPLLPHPDQPAPEIDAAPPVKFMRDIGGLIGRGKSIQDAARTLLDKHPGEEDAIRRACELIIERQI